MPVEDIEKKKNDNELEETWPQNHIPEPPPRREETDTSRDADNTTEDEKPDRLIKINR